jgi:ankyrin repeat protein
MSDVALIEAVKVRDAHRVEEFIQNGADVNQQDEQGWTPLNFAAGKGNLPLVKLLVENGADIFKVGRDQRTPRMIALAAGRVSVVKYLQEMEKMYPGEKPVSPERKYCKAYRLGELRKFPGWTELRIKGKESAPPDQGDSESNVPFTDDKIVFIHHDFSVTESMWHGENVISNSVSAAWKEFCAETLKFKEPDDLFFIIPNEAAHEPTATA